MARYKVRIKTSAIKELEAVVPKKERQRLAADAVFQFTRFQIEES